MKLKNPRIREVEWMTVEKAAEEFGLSKAQVRRIAADDRLESKQLDGHFVVNVAPLRSQHNRNAGPIKLLFTKNQWTADEVAFLEGSLLGRGLSGRSKVSVREFDEHTLEATIELPTGTTDAQRTRIRNFIEGWRAGYQAAILYGPPRDE